MSKNIKNEISKKIKELEKENIEIDYKIYESETELLNKDSELNKFKNKENIKSSTKTQFVASTVLAGIGFSLVGFCPILPLGALFLIVGTLTTLLGLFSAINSGYKFFKNKQEVKEFKIENNMFSSKKELKQLKQDKLTNEKQINKLKSIQEKIEKITYKQKQKNPVKTINKANEENETNLQNTLE